MRALKPNHKMFSVYIANKPVYNVEALDEFDAVVKAKKWYGNAIQIIQVRKG